MFEQILPRRVYNSYLGHKFALWLFGAVVFMKTGIGVGTIFNGRGAATSADGNLPAAHLVSCRHTTSGFVSSSQERRRGSRAFTELTFHVARRIPPPCHPEGVSHSPGGDILAASPVPCQRAPRTARDR